MTDSRRIEVVVRDLARSHFEIEEGVEQIIWVRDGGGGEIRLIEVNRNTFPTDSVEMFYFAPSDEVPFPIRIADVTPQEWERIRIGRIPLPSGWHLDDVEIFERN